MACAERSFAVLDSPARVWAAVSDLSRWDRLLIVSRAAEKGWGDKLLPRGPLGPGASLAMLSGRQVVQEWAVDEWQPAAKLVLSSRRWFGRPRGEMRSRLSIELSPVSPVETGVKLRLETRFSHAVLGPFLNLAVPLRRELRAILGRMEDGITARLCGG